MTQPRDRQSPPLGGDGLDAPPSAADASETNTSKSNTSGYKPNGSPPSAAQATAQPQGPLDDNGWQLGVKDALPLLGGYIPVAMSFGLVATQAGFSVLQACVISGLVYAGASQFLFVAMVASGAPVWLVVGMTLLINARHLVYAPNIAPYIPQGRHWLLLMHGLTDQLFALSHSRMPQLTERARLPWYVAAASVAWLSWVGGTWLGAVAGSEISSRWPLLAQVFPFALPALFIVLLAPKFTDRPWSVSLALTIVVAFVVKVAGFANAAVVLAACMGTLLYLWQQPSQNEVSHG